MKNIKQVNPYISDQELMNVSECFSENWLTEGPWVKKFIAGASEIVGENNILPAPNGTLGLYLAILALDLPPKSEIIIPSFTFYASAMAVIFAGHIPVIVDVDPVTYQMDLDKVEELITTNTKAIMPVHVYGASVNMSKCMSIANVYGLKVIEDAAQSFGVKSCGKHTGTMGDIGVISFFADKTITMGEGALVVTQHEDLFEKVKLLRNQGRPNSGTFIHPELGMNFRITDMQAAVGCAQLLKFDEIKAHRRKCYDLYKKELSGLDLAIHEPSEEYEYIPFRFAFTCKKKLKVQEYLVEKGVETRSFFYPMHLQPKLKKFKTSKEMHVSEHLYESGICLPVHKNITEEDISYISLLIGEALR